MTSPKIINHSDILSERISDTYLLLGPPPTEGKRILYWIYVMYGFAMLIIFNAVLSTLDYFIKSMPNHKPSFFVSFGFNLLVMLFLGVVILKGHLIPFKIKNNFMMFLSIPLALALPLSS